MRSLNLRSFVSALQVPVVCYRNVVCVGLLQDDRNIPTYPMAMSETRTMWTNGFFWEPR